MIGSKLRQIRFGLANPRATVGYPLAPLDPDPAYRGRVTVETERCVGCGACADVCPSRCVLITDLDSTTRVIRRFLDRCIVCGRCEEACAYDACHLVPDWENGTPDRHDLFIEQRLYMGVCDRCGRCAVPAHPLDRPERLGMRVDEPEFLAAERARPGGNGRRTPAPEPGTAARGNRAAGTTSPPPALLERKES